MDVIFNACHVLIHFERLSFRVELLLFYFNAYQCSDYAHHAQTTNEEALLAELEAKKKDPKKMKKTGFAARLEAMQKQQEQMMKEKQNRK